MSRLDARAWKIIGGVVIWVAGLFLFSPVFQAGFWTDDFVFLEWAARRSVADYFAFYFDPRNLELSWYRPIQGLQWWIEYQFFGVNPLGYHVVNVAFHIANSLLLFNLVTRFTRSWSAGLLSALAFLSLPLIAFDVFWPGVADPLMALFYLASLSCWIIYLEDDNPRAQWLALIAFAGALLTKEMGATLIAILFLADRILVNRHASLAQLAQRYLPFVAVMVPYVAIEYVVSTRGVYVGQVAYRPSSQVIANAVQYTRWMLLPWDFGEPWNQLALALIIATVLYFIAIKRARAVLFVTIAGLIATLPVLPFPFAIERYIYLPVLATMALLGLGFTAVNARAPSPFARTALFSATLALLVWNGTVVNDRAVSYTGFVRDTRLQFRPIFQKHATFSSDTLLYFIEPPFPTPTISAMMFVRYGANVRAYGTDRGRVAGLRNYAAAFIYYRDDQNELQEISAAPVSQARALTPLPARFADGIQLDAFELAADRVARGEPLALLLYWRALKPIPKNYTLFVHLVDARGNIIAGYDSQPHQGAAPTLSWRADIPVADGIIVPIDANVAPGDYVLEIGWYEPSSGQRLAVLDQSDQPSGDTIVIAPIGIGE